LIFRYLPDCINQRMKRKVQHDAVNNQEDEDSSAYPIGYPGDQASDKGRSVENSVTYFSSEAPGNNDALAGNQKYPLTHQ